MENGILKELFADYVSWSFSLLPRSFRKLLLMKVYKKRLIKLRRKVKKNKLRKKFKKR